MLNLNEIITRIDAAKAELNATQALHNLQDFELRILRDHLDTIRTAVSTEIGRKAAVSNGSGDAYKVFLRIIKGIEGTRPCLKGAFYTNRDHYLSVCDGSHAIRMFRDDFNPPMVPEGETPIDLDKIYKGIDTMMDTMERIELPSVQTLKAYSKMETAARRAKYAKKYDPYWTPRYAIQHDAETGNCVRCFDTKLLIDVLEAIPDAAAYARKTDGKSTMLYLRGTDGDAIVLPVILKSPDDFIDAVKKSEALMNGSYFTEPMRSAV